MDTNNNDPTWTYCPDPQTEPLKKPLQINSVAICDDGSCSVFGTSFERGDGVFNTYVMNADGKPKWFEPFGTGSTTQGVFWVDISGDGNYVACGGQTSSTVGLLNAYEVDSEKTLLNVQTNSRINQVSLSQSGEYLAACYDQTLVVYQLNSDASAYQAIYTHTDATFEFNSCVISRNGSRVVASGIHYSDDNDAQSSGKNTAQGTTGMVLSLSISDGTVTLLGQCALTTGCMRVAVVDSGYFWAASLHDGSCVLIEQNKPTEALWSFKPDNTDLSLAYAVDITQTDEGEVFVACGANLDNTVNGGLVYLVKSERLVYDDEGIEYPPPKYQGIMQWSTEIQYGVNPGVSMDKNANYVTATDGKPDGQTVHESAGSFYLFAANQGELIWQYNTSMMNWPMQLAQDGTSVIGASDNGTLYFWKLETN